MFQANVLTAKPSFRQRLKRGQRIILTTALFIGLVKGQKVDQEALDECNHVFDLVSDVRALELPAILSKRVWDMSLIDKARRLLREGKLSEATDTLSQNMPRWLKFGEDIQVRMEFGSILSKMSQNYHLA